MSLIRIVAASIPLLLLTAFAQESAPTATPPPEVEAALRARVSEYYAACVARKYRDAEKLLTEDSQDNFYNSPKPKYNGFEIQKIDWSENFTKATVFVQVTVDMPLGSVTIPGHPTAEGDWRLVDGQWYQHLVTPQDRFRMPFGAVVKLDPAPEGGADAPKLDMSKFSKSNIQERAKEIMTGVKPDRETVVFDSLKPGEATVHISNGTPSVTGLELVDPKLKGLTVSLDKSKLSPMEQATLTLRWKPRDKLAKPTTMVHLKVAPSGQDITIQLNFSFAAVQPGSAALTRP